jgi:hypothetical protein
MGEECVICLEKQATTIVEPCGHVVLCDNETCFGPIINSHKNCPMCRVKIDKITLESGVEKKSSPTTTKVFNGYFGAFPTPEDRENWWKRHGNMLALNLEGDNAFDSPDEDMGSLTQLDEQEIKGVAAIFGFFYNF